MNWNCALKAVSGSRGFYLYLIITANAGSFLGIRSSLRPQGMVGACFDRRFLPDCPGDTAVQTSEGLHSVYVNAGSDPFEVIEDAVR
jgi:hypothetical protein